MKVSRKVGRRSRSSISRRRLRNKKSRSGSKKKHTQRGGKRGPGQKRMRVRTHKRGRRFHRGGVNCVDTATPDDKIITISIDTSGVITPDPKNDNVVFSASKYKKCYANNMCHDIPLTGVLLKGIFWLKIVDVTLKYTKKTGTLGGVFNKKGVSSPFEVVIIKKKSEEDYYVILTRKDGNVGQYGTYGSSLEVFFMIHSSTLVDPKKLQIMESNQPVSSGPSTDGHMYDFNFTENTPYFNYIAKAAKFLQDYDKKQSEVKAQNEASKNDAVIETATSDDLEVKLSGETKPQTFGNFKKEFIEFARVNKQKLDDNQELTDGVRNKNKNKIMIDQLLLQILLARYKLMRRIYFNDNDILYMYDSVKEEVTSDLLTQTTRVREIIEKLGNGLQDQQSNFDSCIEAITKLISTMGSDQYVHLDTKQEQKLAEELKQELEQKPGQNDDDLLSSAAHVAPENQEITA